MNIATDYDLVLKHATLLTAEANCPVIDDAFLAIKGNQIERLTTASNQPEHWQARQTLDLTGHVITPGFVNVHTHTILTMVRGVAEDLGFAPAYTPGIPQGSDVTPDEAYALARLGALEAMLFGSTLINDTYVHADVTLPAMADVGLRVHACSRIHDVDFTRVAAGELNYKTTIGNQTLQAALDLATLWHGKADGRIGVQLAAHAPDTCSPALLRQVASASEGTGLRVNTHLAQSRLEVERVGELTGLTPAELLDETGLLNSRLIAAHCLFLNETDIKRVGQAGITVAHIPKGNATGGTMAPTPTLRTAGANLALGTDNMHADMVEVMRWALAIARLQIGHVSDDWQPHHVFTMATMAGAAAMGLADQIGSLTAGKKADLVAFNFQRPHLTPCVNPLGNLVHTGQGRDVALVVVNGQVVVQAGEATQVDEAEIRFEAAKAAQQLWQRCS